MKRISIAGAVPALLAVLLAACHTVKPAKSDAPSMETAPVPAPATTPAADSLPAPAPAGKTSEWLTRLLQQYPQYFDRFIQQPGRYQVQVIYTQINRDAANRPSFENFYYHTDPLHYFYPASVVKMPIAFLALQKINELRSKGVLVDRNSTMITESGGHHQTAVYNDPTTPGGQPTIGHYIKKIFLVSDNDAFNRLYEFLGQEYINSQLQRMGYKQAEILHRLSIALSEEDNRHTNPVIFYDSAGRELYRQPAQYNSRTYSRRSDMRGKGFISDGKLVNGPFNFSKKNRLTLEDMQQQLLAVLFPQQTGAAKKFNLTEDDYTFLRQCMSQLPGESKYPSYPAPTYWDAYLKFNLFGCEKTPLPKNIRVFNKSGQAYGYLTDVCYVADFENKIEFMLSATIHVNSDGIFNDDQYEYATEGFPFLKNLGTVIYEYEKKRVRKHQPVLDAFRIAYAE